MPADEPLSPPRVCPTCGTVLDDGARFCPGCASAVAVVEPPPTPPPAPEDAGSLPAAATVRGLPDQPTSCPVCKGDILPSLRMLCAECHRPHHLECWIGHQGCGESFCSSWRCHVDEPSPWLFVEGDGSFEFVSRYEGAEFKLAMASLVGLLGYLTPVFRPGWAWVQSLAGLLFLVPILPYVVVRYGLRESIHASSTARSRDRRTTLAGLTVPKRPGLLLADESVEVVRTAENADADELARRACQRARGAGGRQRTVRYTAALLAADGTCTELFSRTTRNEDEVVAVVERVARIMDCPVRRLYQGQRLTPQQIRTIVGRRETERKQQP